MLKAELIKERTITKGLENEFFPLGGKTEGLFLGKP